jgi:hypothetical protein
MFVQKISRKRNRGRNISFKPNINDKKQFIDIPDAYLIEIKHVPLDKFSKTFLIIFYLFSKSLQVKYLYFVLGTVS